MAYITGSDTIAGIRQGTTYGTAVAIGTGHKLVLEDLSPSRSVTVGETNGIGSGLSMADEKETLSTEDTVSINQQARYDDGGFPVLAACFFGASTASPAEENVGEGDYLHRVTWLGTANKFVTVAFQSSSATAIEYPSCYVQGLNIETGNTPGYLTYTADLLANTRVLTSVTNTFASLASATVLGSSKVVHQTNDYVWLNSQSGDALDSGDAVCPETVSISFARPNRIANCFGGSEILKDGMFEASVTLTFATMADHTYFTQHHSATEHKMLLNIEGSQIGAGENKRVSFFFPKLKAVETPEYSVSASGANPLTVTYTALVASANPNGMDSVYPYIEFVNENSAAIIS